jgi:hypothetical protein
MHVLHDEICTAKKKKQKIWFEILRCRYSMESCPKSYAKIIYFGYK